MGGGERRARGGSAQNCWEVQPPSTDMIISMEINIKITDICMTVYIIRTASDSEGNQHCCHARKRILMKMWFNDRTEKILQKYIILLLKEKMCHPYLIRHKIISLV